MATRSTKDSGAPSVVGRYELIAPIVSGALGQLWRARIASGPEEGRVVDIRRIPRSEGLDASHVERLTNAGFAAMELRHPRIAAVLDVVVAPAEIAIVSEHIDAVIVQDLVRPRNGQRIAVSAAIASRIALDLLEAIEAVKEPWAELFPSPESDEERLLRACVHGGMVPDGLLVAGFGEAMLLETGLAGVALTIPAILDHPDVIAYRAPEQLQPGKGVDERADVFTIGVVLWEMIAGRSLFGASPLPRPPTSLFAPRAASTADAVQVSAARRKVLTQPIPRIDSLPLLKGKVPMELADLLARCLERDPALRFQSVREAISAFAALDADALSRHDAVAKLVSAFGLTGADETPPSDAGPSSNRPTTPPVDDPSGRPPPDLRGEGVTRPGTSLKRPAPSPPSTERSNEDDTRDFPVSGSALASGATTEPRGIGSVLPPSTEVDSSPPPSSAGGEALLADAESVPPSSVELDTLPPLADIVAATELPAVEGSVTLMSGVAHSEPEPGARASETSVAAATAPSPSSAADAAATQGEETTSAPVVRPLDLASAHGPSLGDSVLGGPIESVRRVRSRKVVFAVMAVAALLGLIGLLRAILSSGPEEARSAISPPAATLAVASAPAAAAPSGVPAVPEPPPTNEPEAPGAAPTSVPGVASASPAEAAARKQGRKRPYRPSGI